jgi:hypothetical protein
MENLGNTPWAKEEMSSMSLLENTSQKYELAMEDLKIAKPGSVDYKKAEIQASAAEKQFLNNVWVNVIKQQGERKWVLEAFGKVRNLVAKNSTSDAATDAVIKDKATNAWANRVTYNISGPTQEIWVWDLKIMYNGMWAEPGIYALKGEETLAQMPMNITWDLSKKFGLSFNGNQVSRNVEWPTKTQLPTEKINQFLQEQEAVTASMLKYVNDLTNAYTRSHTNEVARNAKAATQKEQGGADAWLASKRPK